MVSQQQLNTTSSAGRSQLGVVYWARLIMGSPSTCVSTGIKSPSFHLRFGQPGKAFEKVSCLPQHATKHSVHNILTSFSGKKFERWKALLFEYWLTVQHNLWWNVVVWAPCNHAFDPADGCLRQVWWTRQRYGHFWHNCGGLQPPRPSSVSLSCLFSKWYITTLALVDDPGCFQADLFTHSGPGSSTRFIVWSKLRDWIKHFYVL